MKKLFTLLTMLIVGIGSSWATDYSGSYYYIQTSQDSKYGFYSSTNTTQYGSTSAITSAVIFTFEKTEVDNEYYWYNCTNKKYIYVDESGNLKSADSKATDNDSYKWYFISNSDGTVTITDKGNYNSGNPSKGLVTRGSSGSWWGVEDLSNSDYIIKTWNLIPFVVEMKKPYYIALGRGGNRYLQYSSSDNKMKQVVANTKDYSHIWYFTDEGNDVIYIHPLTSSSAMGYASNASAGADKISTTNAVKDFKLKISDKTAYPIAFLSNAGSNTLYLSNHGGTNAENMGLYGTLNDNGTSMKTEAASVNAYIGATKTIGATEWKTQSNWVHGNVWNSNGPGYSNSNMWLPIYLNGVTATGIEFEGWALQLKLVNSSLTATTKKIQTEGTLTIDVDEESTLDLTLTSSNNNDGTHIFNIDGALTINMGENNWNNINSTNTINLGTTGSFTFTASSSKTIGESPSFTLNATLLDPGASYNTLVSRTLATFDKVTLTTLTTNISGVDDWTLVSSKEALEEQTAIGKYYYVEENKSSGVTLWMYKLQKYNVAEGEEETLSNITNYADYEEIYVPSNSTLNIDVEGFDLTKISGAGTVVLDADITVSGSKSTVATGKLTINEGKTLTLGTGQGQANSIESFTSIELAGTIKHKNSVATFNSVTVPTGKTGKIFAYDMGNTSDGFKLAGTTTLVGDLVVCSKYNFQMKVDVLAGSGGCLICGTTDDNYDASGTSSNETATINIASASSYTGNATVNNSKATVNLAGNLVGSSWTKTNGTLNYAGNNLNGTTLDGVILSGTARINTSNTVNIKNLAGNNLNNTSNLYAFVGSGTINFYGTNDLTKKSDGTVCNSANIGYGASDAVIIKAGANVTAGIVQSSATLSSNAPITVEETATLTCVGSTGANNNTLLIYSTSLTNNGTINLNAENRYSKVSALNGSGTINFASGAEITTPSVPNTMTLTGAGDVVLTSFPSATAPTLSAWTGIVEFPDNSSKTANITDIFNAWGNANSTINLKNLNGYFSDTFDPVLPTLNILSGKTLTISDGYSDYPPTLSKLTGEGNLNISWNGSKDSYKLTVQKLKDFSGTLSTVKVPIIVNKLVVADAPYADTRLIKTSGTVTLEALYIGLQETTAYSWVTKTVEDIEGIYVTDIDQVQLCREMAENVVSPYLNYIGTGVGKYTITLGLNKYNSIEYFMAALNAWTTTADYVEPSVAINQPTSAFYRIKSGDKYLQDARKSDSATQRTLTDAAGANESAETIFYLDNNKFIGYKTGYGFGYSVCQTQDTEQLNTQLFTESAEMGKYTIQSQKGTCTSADHNVGYWGVNDSELSRVDDAASGACWTLEPATSVPVTFNAAALGYATFNSPVALKVPTDVKAYVCKIEGSTITLHNANKFLDGDNWILPANTPVLLYNKEYETNATKDFEVTSTTESYEDLNDFKYTVYAATPNNTDYTYYALRKKSGAMGFYQRADQTAVLPGFRAWIMDPITSAREFTIVFDGEDNPTGIAEALGLENDNVEIYDLNGRKLSSYKHGINIVNGKKVFK